MTARLEAHYRRLLRVYPAAHREAYEEEMLAVLMQGARPGRHRPSAAEVTDLLWSGMLARAGRGLSGLHGVGWRDAAGVVGLLGAVVLALVPMRRPILTFAMERQYGQPIRILGWLGIDDGRVDAAERAVVWLLVVTAVVLGARRAAAALGVAGVLVEVTSVVLGAHEHDFLPIAMSWVMMLSALVAGLLVPARRGRPAGEVLRRTGTALATSPLAVAALAGAVVLTVPGAPRWLNESAFGYAGHQPSVSLVAVLAAVPLAVTLLLVPPGVRGRVLVLLAPLVAVPVAQSTMEDMIGMQFALTVTPEIVVTDVLMMTGLPLLAFLAAAAALYARENLTVSVRRPPA